MVRLMGARRSFKAGPERGTAGTGSGDQFLSRLGPAASRRRRNGRACVSSASARSFRDKTVLGLRVVDHGQREVPLGLRRARSENALPGAACGHRPPGIRARRSVWP